MEILEKLIQDVDVINNLLYEYYNIVFRRGEDYRWWTKWDPSKMGDLDKKHILIEMQSTIDLLFTDIKIFENTTCTSETQKDTENENLVGFGNAIRRTASRLYMFNEMDENLKTLIEKFVENVKEFSNALQNYIQASPYKVYTLQWAIEVGKLEESKFLEKIDFYGKIG